MVKESADLAKSMQVARPALMSHLKLNRAQYVVNSLLRIRQIEWIHPVESAGNARIDFVDATRQLGAPTGSATRCSTSCSEVVRKTIAYRLPMNLGRRCRIRRSAA